jgi:hypothetical protein
MQLIGMLDSPYVRRVAISLKLMGCPSSTGPSVFRNVDEFRGINPVVKALTLVCDDGVVLMDSTPSSITSRAWWPPSAVHAVSGRGEARGAAARGWHCRCDKSVSLIYERSSAPEKRHEP